MSQNSKQTIERLKRGDKAIWGRLGPFFVSEKSCPAACDYDINLRSANSLLKKGIIYRKFDSDGIYEILLKEKENQ